MSAGNGTVLEIVRDIFTEVIGVDRAMVVPQARPEDISGWDSLTHATVCTALEERLHISFEVEDLMEMDSIGAMLNVVARLSA